MLDEAIAVALWWIVLFSASFLFSTLLEHVVSVISMTIISGIGLFALTITVMDGLGGSLSGVTDEDPALWAIMLIPAFAAGSYFAFSRGELLRSRRRWAVAAVAFAAVAVVTVATAIGSVRFATRYERALVQHVRPAAVSRDARVVALWGLRLPVTLGIFRRVPVRLPSLPRADSYRSRHLVLVDTDSGRELLVRRGLGTGAVSPDGRLLAVIPEAFALTWRLQLSGMPTKGVEIRRVRDGHLVYAGWREDYARFGAPHDVLLQWSPDSSWLAIESVYRWQWHRLLLMRRDGRHPVGLHLAPEYNLNPPSTCQASSRATPQRWAWNPRGGGMYLLTDDAPRPTGTLVLARCDLPSGAVTPIWKPAAELPPEYDWLSGAVAPSPDGRLLAVGMAAVPFQPSPYGGRPEPSWNGRSLVFVFLLSPDGSRRQLLSRSGFRYLDHNYRCGVTDWAWSKDGTRLWYLVKSEYGDKRDLFLWRKGDTAATPLALPPDYVAERIAALPGRAEALVWGRDAAFIADERGRIRRLPGVAASYDARQRLLLGVDGRGRAVVCDVNLWGGAGCLGLVDLDTGNFKQVYP
jgi:hypothetical protein